LGPFVFIKYLAQPTRLALVTIPKAGDAFPPNRISVFPGQRFVSATDQTEKLQGHGNIDRPTVSAAVRQTLWPFAAESHQPRFGQTVRGSRN